MLSTLINGVKLNWQILVLAKDYQYLQLQLARALSIIANGGIFIEHILL